MSRRQPIWHDSWHECCQSITVGWCGEKQHDLPHHYSWLRKHQPLFCMFVGRDSKLAEICISMIYILGHSQFPLNFAGSQLLFLRCKSAWGHFNTNKTWPLNPLPRTQRGSFKHDNPIILPISHYKFFKTCHWQHNRRSLMSLIHKL